MKFTHDKFHPFDPYNPVMAKKSSCVYLTSIKFQTFPSSHKEILCLSVATAFLYCDSRPQTTPDLHVVSVDSPPLNVFLGGLLVQIISLHCFQALHPSPVVHTAASCLLIAGWDSIA